MTQLHSLSAMSSPKVAARFLLMAGVVSLGTFDGDPDVFARQSGPFPVTIEAAEE